MVSTCSKLIEFLIRIIKEQKVEDIARTQKALIDVLKIIYLNIAGR